MDATKDFTGAKLMLFLGPDLVVLRRDHAEGIPFPGFLDFPGGGREPGETPEECALRETYEEVGLRVGRDALTWSHRHEQSVFFAARLSAEAVNDIVFGGEGDGWMLMRPEIYASRADAIPHFRDVLRLYLAQQP